MRSSKESPPSGSNVFKLFTYLDVNTYSHCNTSGDAFHNGNQLYSQRYRVPEHYEDRADREAHSELDYS